jgi:hypothetical protein
MTELARTTAYPLGLLWTDAFGPGTSARVGSSAPTFAAFQGGVYANRMDKGDEIHFSVQVPHNFAPGSELHFHVHWTVLTGSVNTETIIWGLEWYYAGIGQTWTQAASADEITVTLAGTEDNKHMLTEFTAVNPSNFSYSGIAVCRLYRKNAGTSAANPFYIGCDAHYQLGPVGTVAELGP